MKKTIQISDRLKALAQMIGQTRCLADVGTDHGYIPIYLCQTDAVERAIAMDINEGPIRAATENTAAYGFSERIEKRLSDGMAKLEPGEASAVLVAGMGGHLVMHIVSESLEVARELDFLVLQPQSDIAMVREYLRTEKFEIIDEDMVFEDGKFYPFMKVKFSPDHDFKLYNDWADGSDKDACQAAEDLFGPVLLKKKHPVLKTFLIKEKDVCQMITARLADRKDEAHIAERLEEIAYKESLITLALDCMEG